MYTDDLSKLFRPILTKHGTRPPLVKVIYVYPMERQHRLQSYIIVNISGIAPKFNNLYSKGFLDQLQPNLKKKKFFVRWLKIVEIDSDTSFQQEEVVTLNLTTCIIIGRKLFEGLDNVSKVINLVDNILMWFVRFSVWMRNKTNNFS